MKTIKHLFHLISLALLISNYSHADTTATAPVWSQLNSTQQTTLQSLKNHWDTLPSDRRQAILRGLSQWQALSTAQREQTQQRFAQWQALPNEQQEQLRQQFQQFQHLPDTQKQQLRERYQQFLSLPPPQRDQLRERFEQQRAEAMASKRPDEIKAPNSAAPQKPDAINNHSHTQNPTVPNTNSDAHRPEHTANSAAPTLGTPSTTHSAPETQGHHEQQHSGNEQHPGNEQSNHSASGQSNSSDHGGENGRR